MRSFSRTIVKKTNKAIGKEREKRALRQQNDSNVQERREPPGLELEVYFV